MNRQEIYQRSVDILLDAYNAKELIPASICGCAVGNLIRKTYPVVKTNYFTQGICGDWIMADNHPYTADWYFKIIDKRKTLGLSKRKALNQINSTGYTIEEIILIERTFEEAARYSSTLLEEKSLSGLRAVLDLLAKIHQAEEIHIKETRKKLQEV